MMQLLDRMNSTVRSGSDPPATAAAGAKGRRQFRRLTAYARVVREFAHPSLSILAETRATAELVTRRRKSAGHDRSERFLRSPRPGVRARPGGTGPRGARAA